MKLKLLIIVFGLTILVSCKTYYIPINSFKNQFWGIDSSKLMTVKVIGPVGEEYKYLANPIKTIYCVDKQGNPYELQNSPSIEIRFTYGDKNKRTSFYFDRVFVNDTTIIGVQSRFISAIRKTISLKSIKKIEVQDGRKNFHYTGNY